MDTDPELTSEQQIIADAMAGTIEDLLAIAYYGIAIAIAVFVLWYGWREVRHYLGG